jgi:hypothetical protein
MRTPSRLRKALPLVLLLAAPLLPGCVVAEAPHHGYYPAHAHYAAPSRPLFYTPRRVWAPPPRHHYDHHRPRHHQWRHDGPRHHGPRHDGPRHSWPRHGWR